MNYDYRPTKFFVATFALSWSCWFLAAALATSEEREGAAFLFNGLGLFSPMIVALIVVFRSGNAALKRDFTQRLYRLRLISPRHLLATFLLPPVMMVAALLLSLAFGQSTEQFRLSGPVDQLLPLILLAFVLAPIIEELGWRGYGMDSLRARMGMLRASVVFGLLWSAWHAPLVLIKGTYHYELAHMDNPLYLVNFFVSVVAASVFVSWLYYKHNRSILAGVLLHSVLNAAAVLPDATQDTKCLATVLYVVVAVVLVRWDRDLFRQGPRNYLKAEA